MTRVAPPVDCLDVVIAGVRISARESAGLQVRELRIEFIKPQPQATRCHFWANVTRLDAKSDAAHNRPCATSVTMLHGRNFRNFRDSPPIHRQRITAPANRQPRSPKARAAGELTPGISPLRARPGSAETGQSRVAGGTRERPGPRYALARPGR